MNFLQLASSGRPFFSSEYYTSGWSGADLLVHYGLLALAIAAMTLVAPAILRWAFDELRTDWMPTWMRIPLSVLVAIAIIVAYVWYWRLLGPIGEHLPAATARGKFFMLLLGLGVPGAVLASLAVWQASLPLDWAPTLWKVILGAAFIPPVCTGINIFFTGIPILSNLTPLAVMFVVAFGLLGMSQSRHSR